MKRTLVAFAALGLAAAAAPAFAQGWAPISAREANLDRRIDRGLRDGSLTDREASRLRGEFRDILRLETRYRETGGLQNWERADLDRRFDRLSAEIRDQRHDAQNAYGDRYGRYGDRYGDRYDAGRDAGFRGR